MIKLRNAIKRIVKTYQRYIISYCVVFLTPLIVLGYVVYLPVMNIIERQAISNQERQLTQLMGIVDTRFSELESINHQISVNINLTNYSLTSKDSYSKFLASRELRKILSSNYFIRDVAIYLSSIDHIICSSGFYTTERYFSLNRAQIPMDFHEFKKWLDETSAAAHRRKVFFANNIAQPQGNLVAMYPLNINAVMYILDQRHLVSLMQSNIEDKDAICIILENDNIIAGTAHQNLYNIAGSFLLNYDKQQKSREVIIYGIDYFVSQVESRRNGWNYYLLTPREVLFSQVYNLRRTMMTATTALVVVIIGIMFFLSYISHRPVKKLRKFLDDSPQLSADNVELNDFEAIDEHLNSIINNYHTITKQTDMNKTLLKKHFIVSLINETSDIEVDEQMETIMHHVGLRLHNELFRVCVAFIPAEVYFQNNDIPLMIELEGNDQFRINVINKNMEKGKYFFIILNYPQTHSSYEYIENILNNIKRCVSGANCIFYLGCGSEQHELASLGKSFLEACFTLESNLSNNGSNRLLHDHFEDISINDALELNNKIQSGKYQQMSKVIERIESYADTLDIHKSICYLLGVFYQVYMENHVHSVSPFTPNIQLTSMLSADFNEYKTKILQVIRRISDDNCAYNNKKSSSEEDPGKIILSYVEQNLYNAQFNLKEFALDMGVSQSYLTRYFKQQTGESITGYILTKRINRAKQLLEHSDMSVKEIGSACGYNDISNFYRKFKSIENVTPSEYRKMIANI